MQYSGFRQIDIQEVQRIQLRVFKAIAAICEEYAIPYYLSGGTLLGAVRHKGFIPWDDDLDIQIPRPDYIRFIEVLQKGVLPEEFTFSWLTDATHIVPFLKIYYTESLIVEAKIEPAYRETKIWVDVFPIDGLPQNKFLLYANYFIAKQMRNLLYTGIVSPESLKGFERVGTILLKPISRLIGPNRLAGLIDKFSQRKNFYESAVIGCLVWGISAGEALEKGKYLPIIKLSFEGVLASCPKAYDEHLRNLYGDYMQAPPVEDRYSHSAGEYYLRRVDA